MADVQSKVVEIIVDKLGVKESEVVPEASFTNHLGADSLDTVELIMEFEKAFDIQILTRMQRRSLPLATLSPISRHTRNNLRFFQPANLKALNL